MPDCEGFGSHPPSDPADPGDWGPFFPNFTLVRDTPPPRPNPAPNPADQVFIGHLDTGFTDSPHLDLSRLEIGESKDLYSPQKSDARTPLELLPIFPGTPVNFHNHGTGTLSVVIGKSGIVPAAPAVKIIPYRICTNPFLYYSEMCFAAAAIGHFLTSVEKTLQQPPPHVVAISLGSWGPNIGSEHDSPGGAWMGREILKRTIKEYTKKGVIFVAASAQIPRLEGFDPHHFVIVRFWADAAKKRMKVTFPASMREVISAGALDRQSVPNPAGFYDGPIDIMAPGVDVKMGRAYRTAGDQLDPRLELSSGSSYSAQFTGAAAALWIEHHGKDFLTRTYGLDLITELFRFCLVSSGNAPHPDHLDRTDAPRLNVDCLLRFELPTKAELQASLP